MTSFRKKERKKEDKNTKPPVLFFWITGGLCLYYFKRAYLVIRSSHFNINSIANIEIKQATTKTVHVNQIGICS